MAVFLPETGRRLDMSRLPRVALLTWVLAACSGKEDVSGTAVKGDAPAHASGASDAADEGSPGGGAHVTVDGGEEAAPDAPSDIPVGASVSAQPDGSVEPLVDAPPGDALADGDASPPPDGSIGSPTVLVSNLYNPREVAVDDVNVYFTAMSTSSTDDAVYQIPKNAAGTTPVELSGNDRQPLSLASDGAYIYWNDTLDPVAIRRIIVGGNGATTLADAGPVGMSMSPTTLFWVSSGMVQSMPKAGGTVTTLGTAPTGAVWGVAIDPTYFYFAASPSTQSATISRVPQSGGLVTSLATLGTNVNVLASDGVNLYFVSGDNLISVPTAGGVVFRLAGGFSGTTSLTLDSGNLYASIANGNGPHGSLLRIPAAGGTPTVLASAQWGVYDAAVDATSIYWTDFGGPSGTGEIMVAPK